MIEFIIWVTVCFACFFIGVWCGWSLFQREWGFLYKELTQRNRELIILNRKLKEHAEASIGEVYYE